MNLEIIPADSLSLALFFSTVAFVLFLILYGTHRVGRKVFVFFSIFLIGWIFSFSVFVQSGILKQHLFPGAPLFFLSILLAGLGIGVSSFGRQLSQLPIWMLVFFQSFRFPLEIVLHLWAGQGTVPETMTWTGQNFDIATGILALGSLLPLGKSKTYAWVFNVIGIGLLLNVFRVVILSSPLPFSWQLERPLVLVLYLPYALIGFVCVWAAILGHVVLTRSLLQK